MPEIVEVKKFTDFLNEYLKNQTLNSINVVKGRYKKHGIDLKKIKSKLPLKFVKAYSKGKFIYTDFNKVYLCFTLGLTGGFVYLPSNSKKFLFPKVQDYTDNTKDYYQTSLNHRNLELKFDSGTMYFHDKLSYGTVSVLLEQELQKKLNKIGPEVINISYKEFIELVRKRNNKEIGNVIVDQKLLSGVGNYLRADSLWLAKISPFRKVTNITDSELKKLYDAIVVLIWNDYDLDYAKKHGIINSNSILPQKYNRVFLVYRQDTDIYSNKVVKQDLFENSVKRSIFWVPKVQK